MAYDIEAISRVLSQESAQQSSNQHYGGGGGRQESPYWEKPYTWESYFGIHSVPNPATGQVLAGDPVFAVRHIGHPDNLPGGVRLNTTHKLFNSPNDPKPQSFYCKECFYPRDDNGELPEDGQCMACDCFGPNAITKEIYDALATMPPVRPGGYSGEEVAKMLGQWSANRRIIIPLLVRGIKGVPYNSNGMTVIPYWPSDDPNQVFACMVITNYMSKMHKSLLECYKEDKNLRDWEKGRWLKLTREKAGKGAKTILTNTIHAEPLNTKCLEILKDYPDLAEWGKKAPSAQSSRTTLNISYSEADHLFKNTTWYQDLVRMTEQWIDWE